MSYRMREFQFLGSCKRIPIVFVFMFFPPPLLNAYFDLLQTVSADRLPLNGQLTTVELQWLEHLWDYENLFETG